MGETAVAFAELLESDEEMDSSTSYLLGQLAAELIASDPSTVDLNNLIAITQDAQRAASEQASSREQRRLMCRLLLGLLQGVLAERQASATKAAVSSQTVRQRTLNLLALAPQNPSSVAKQIGCSFATASRALTRLREQGLVGYVETSDQADGRHRMYELTQSGESRLDDWFLGQVADSEEDGEQEACDVAQNYRNSLISLTGAVADLNRHDPRLAAKIYPVLETLKDQVDDVDVRAAALGELSVLARSKPDLVTADRSRSWLDELVALSKHGSSLTAARAYYERARWTMRYRNSDELSIEADLEAAQRHAAEVGGVEGADRIAWCLYQRSSRALWRRDWEQALLLSHSASAEFANLRDQHGVLASRLVSARARLASGDVSDARHGLADLVASAESGGYKRQLADGLFWLGQAKIWNDEPDASETLLAAANSYDALGDRDWTAVAKASAETATFIAGQIDSAAAKTLRKQLAKAQNEIKKSEGASPAHFFKLASIARQIAVLSAYSGERPHQADRAWKSAVADFVHSESPEGVSVTFASYWLASLRSGAEVDDVPSDDAVREIGRRLSTDPLPDDIVESVRGEVDRFLQHSDFDNREYLKHELAYS